MYTSTELPACPAEISDETVEQFRRDGFLAFRDVLSPEEVRAACESLSSLVQEVAHGDNEQVGKFWMKAGTRLGVQFESAAIPDTGDESLELGVRKLMWFADEDELLGNLAKRHPKIRAVLDAVVGANAQLYQDMALVKPPYIGSEKPWHQDNAYFSVSPLSAICGVWIALDEATVENGCMHVLRGHHREALKHIHDRDCEIPLSKLPLEAVEAIELPAGGALFFAGMLPHQTPPNTSPHRRRALQFHYRAADSEILPREKYDALFSEYDGMTGESIPASCAHAR